MSKLTPSAVPLVDDVVETSEMARQNGKELRYSRLRQGQVFDDVYGRCCGSTGANKVASLGRSSTRLIWTRRGIDSAIRTQKSFNRSTCYHALEFFLRS
jgi:hypothetical protein